jgi:hypothetical protein
MFLESELWVKAQVQKAQNLLQSRLERSAGGPEEPPLQASQPADLPNLNCAKHWQSATSLNYPLQNCSPLVTHIKPLISPIMSVRGGKTRACMVCSIVQHEQVGRS